VLLLVCAFGAVVATEVEDDGFVLAEIVETLEQPTTGGPAYQEAVAKWKPNRNSPGIVLTAQQLQAATGCSQANALMYVTHINAATAAYQINTPKRLAGFLSQISAESNGFSQTLESLNYASDIQLHRTFPSFFRTVSQTREYVGSPQKVANLVYGDRLGNGPAASGDGYKYRGRGLIMLTGKTNYETAGKALGQNFVADPNLVTYPEHASMAAAWFWASRGLNTIADSGDVTKMTLTVTGNINGAEKRERLYNNALRAIAGTK